MKAIGYTLFILGLSIIHLEVNAQQPSRFLTMDELFRLGMENSVRINSAAVQERIAEEQLKTARIQRLPDIGIGLEGGNIGQPVIFRRGLSQPERPETPDWSQNYNVEVSQPIYSGGRIRSGIRRAEINRRIASLASTDEEQSVKLLLLENYLNLFSLYKQKEVLARNIEEANIRLKDIRRMREQGLLTRNDELRSELQLTNDRLDSCETEHQIMLDSQSLDILLGLDESLVLVPDTSLLGKALHTEALDRYIQTAYEHNPGMQLAKENTLLAKNNVKLVKADMYPTLSLRAGNTLARPLSSSMEDYYNNTWSIGLSLSYNLSSLYKSRHNLHEARHGVRQQLYAEELQRQAIRNDVRAAYTHHQEALECIRALGLSVRQADENYRIVHNRYLNQLSILTDLLDASNVRLEPELQLTDAKVQAVYTYYELQRICGLL